MSISTAVLIATAATIVNADYTNTWWTPSSVVAASTAVESVWSPSTSASVWAPVSSAVEGSWTPSSESVWTPSSSTVESAWASSSTVPKGNISILTSYTNTVYVTKATTSTQTVDCGKGTMIYGNGSAPAFTPSLGLPSNMPTDLPSDWSKSLPSSVLPPQVSASGGLVTTNCANASVTYTFTYTPSGAKPKKTSSSIIETPAQPTEPSYPSPPTGGDSPAPGPQDGDDDADSSSSNQHGKGKPTSGFSTGDDMDSAGSRQSITTGGAIFTLCVVAIVACML